MSTKINIKKKKHKPITKKKKKKTTVATMPLGIVATVQNLKKKKKKTKWLTKMEL